MKNKTWVIVFSLIALGILILLLMAFRNPDTKRKVETCPDGKTPIPSNGKCPQTSIDNAVSDESGCIQPSSYSDYQYPIRFGMKNSMGQTAISELQHKLNIGYNALLKEDGYWGCKTDQVVKEKLGVNQIYTNSPIWNVTAPLKR